MRYLELEDENKNPIFEGDQLLLTIKNKFFGGSYFGKFCEFFDIDVAKITILENSNILEAKYIIKYYKNDVQIVTNQEYQYWCYVDDCLEANKDAEKTIEDFDNIKDAKELSEDITRGIYFLTYLVGKGVKKTNKFNGSKTIELESNLRLDINLKEEIYVNDVVLVEVSEHIKKTISENKHLIIKGNFTHIKFIFNKRNGQFKCDEIATLTDKDGICKVFEEKLSDEAEVLLRNIDVEESKQKRYKRHNDERFSQSKVDDLQKEYEQICDDKKYKELEDYSLFLGLDNNVKFINNAIKNKLKVIKINKVDIK